MVLPIAGPFSKTVTLKGPTTAIGFKPDYLNRVQTWYRQKKPFDRPLTYSLDVRYVADFWDRRSANNYTTCNLAPTYTPNHITAVTARNKAYDKFRDGIGEQSQWVNNLYEMRHAESVIADAASRLLKFSRAVKKLDANGAAKALGLGKHSVALSSKNTFSQNWLRYHFGIEPLVKDIHAATATFCHDFSPQVIVGRATSRLPAALTTSDPNSTSYIRRIDNWQTSCKIQAQVRVTNPNLFLMNQMGLTNPASWVWEAIPFSFVVDWFGNVGQVLGSMTDLFGVSLENPSTTIMQTSNWDCVWMYGRVGLPAGKTVGEAFSYEKYNMAACRRSLSIAGPTLALKPFKGVSPVRGATAIALLFNFLKR